MRIFLFLSLLIFNYLSAFSQNTLELKNSSTGKTRILKSGAKLYFKTSEDSVFIKGKIVQIKDTSVVIYCSDFSDEDPLVDVRVDQLTVIKKPTQLHSITRSIGTVLLPVGAYFFINGLLTLSRDNSDSEDQTKVLTATGAGLIVAGAIPVFIIKPKTYDLKKGWTLSVQKMYK